MPPLTPALTESEQEDMSGPRQDWERYVYESADIEYRRSQGQQDNAAGQERQPSDQGRVNPVRSPQAGTTPAPAAPFEPDDATRAKVAQAISEHPLIASLLYDIDLLPEQIRDARRYGYMLAVIDHMLVYLSRVTAQQEAAIKLLQEWRDTYGGSTDTKGKPCTPELERRTDELLRAVDSCAASTTTKPK